MDNISSTVFRYSSEELEEFGAIIEKKLAKAKEELAYLMEQILEITANTGDEHGGDWMDDSNINNDMEFLNNMAIRQRKYIQDLENANIRIKNKTYGVCTVTGKLIDKRRLFAVPTATKSVEAKTQPVEKETKIPSEKSAEIREMLAKKQKEGKIPEKKIITKVIRKPVNPRPKPIDEDLDMDDDLDLDDDLDTGVDFEDTLDDQDLEAKGGTQEPDVFQDEDY